MDDGSSASRETLFLKLAIRNGIFSAEDAQKLLEYYRQAAPRGKRIEKFLVEEGYLDEATAGKLVNAIAARAAPPAREPRTKKPTASSRLGQRHASAKTSASPAQLVAIGLGLVVTIGAVVYIASEITGSSKSVDEVIADEQAEREARLKVRNTTTRTVEDDDDSAIVQVSFTEDQLKEFEAQAKLSLDDAKFALMSDRYDRALSRLDTGLEKLEQSAAPDEIKNKLRQQRTELVATRDEAFEKLKSEFEAAKESGDADEMERIQELVGERMGEEFVKQL